MKNLKKLMLLVGCFILIGAAISIVGILTTKTLTESVYAHPDSKITFSEEGVVECLGFDGENIILQGVKEGQTTITLTSGDDIDEMLEIVSYPNGILVETFNGNFTGWRAVLLAIRMVIFCSTAAAILLTIRQIRKRLYSNDTPQICGVSLLLMLISIRTLVSDFLYPVQQVRPYIYGLLNFPQAALILTLPVWIVLTALMIVSNVVLLKKEGKTWNNLLGSGIMLVLCFAGVLELAFSDFSGSTEELIIHDACCNFIFFCFLWVECKLIGIMICGWLAARKEPSLDKDYILILGCMLSKKGGLTPLLRGRVDRALQFREKQMQNTGKIPVMVPCGGQGKNELTTEAAAIREYLIAKGVPASGILMEDKSVNTWENMGNAHRLVMQRDPEAKIAFATTNYHVFRSGIWARKNGMDAEGMGSGTKWYYWPNAFMREYAALIAARMKNEILTMILAALFSAGAALSQFFFM